MGLVKIANVLKFDLSHMHQKVKMKLLFFASIALTATSSDGPGVNCPSTLPDQEFKVCVSDEINRIWKGSSRK